VREANRLGIPVVAIADTNADPDHLTVAIAGNDDAIRSVSLITGVIAEEIEKARRERPEAGEGGEEQGATTYSSDVGEAEAAAGSKKKRPKRRPRPELIRRRRHATDEEAGSPESDGESPAPEAPSASEESPASEAPSASEEPAAPEVDSADAENVVAEEVVIAAPDEGSDGAVEEEREDGGSP